MSGDPGENAVSIIWAVAIGGAVLASLIARRPSFSQTFRHATIWILIFLGIYGIALFRDDLGQVWQRARDDISGSRTPSVIGQETIIRRDDDGHYRVTATVNGHDATFLIDTGATLSVVDQSTAERLGLVIDQQIPPQTMMTANGPMGVMVASPVSLHVGNISADNVALRVGSIGDDVNVLGVDFLNRLSSWRVEGRELHLVP